MKRGFCVVCFLGGLFVLIGWGRAPREIAPAPSVLPNVTREMKTAGFWVSLHPSPDTVLLDEAQIKELNTRMEEELLLTANISRFPLTISGQTIAEDIDTLAQGLKGKPFYFVDGQKVDQKFWKKVRDNMNVSAIPKEGAARFGLVVRYADQRLLPSEQVITAEPGDIDFDEAQNSALDIGTPVAVLHESKDGGWFFTRSPASAGWIKKNMVALCSRQDIEDGEAHAAFVVTLNPKTDIFMDKAMRKFYDHVQMGTKLLVVDQSGAEGIKILYPTRADDGTLVRREGFVNRADVHMGYLAYTPRHILEQAFRLLNAPYGWGGMYGEQDCSRFLQQIFATVGIHLPRNSGEQIRVSPALAVFDERTPALDKRQVLSQQAVGGAALLYFKGHIMLYLGMLNGAPYAIHATWAYRENFGKREIVRVINKVVVSDLSLGKDSARGSLLSRIKIIANIVRAGSAGETP